MIHVQFMYSSFTVIGTVQCVYCVVKSFQSYRDSSNESISDDDESIADASIAIGELENNKKDN